MFGFRFCDGVHISVMFGFYDDADKKSETDVLAQGTLSSDCSVYGMVGRKKKTEKSR